MTKKQRSVALEQDTRNDYLKMTPEQRMAFITAPIRINIERQPIAGFGRSGCMSAQRQYGGMINTDHRVYARPAHE